MYLRNELGEGLVRDGLRLLEALDLVLVLDEPDPVDNGGHGHELNGELLVVVEFADGQIPVLKGALLNAHLLQHGRDLVRGYRPGGLDHLEGGGGELLRLDRVAEIRQQNAPLLRYDEHGLVAREVGEVADVGAVGDYRAVNALFFKRGNELAASFDKHS